MRSEVRKKLIEAVVDRHHGAAPREIAAAVVSALDEAGNVEANLLAAAREEAEARAALEDAVRLAEAKRRTVRDYCGSRLGHPVRETSPGFGGHDVECLICGAEVRE